MSHVTQASPANITWNRTPSGANAPNYFTGGTLPDGNAGSGASMNQAQMVRTTGWRDLQPGQVTREDFRLVGE